MVGKEEYWISDADRESFKKSFPGSKMGYLNEDGSIDDMENEYLSKLQVEKEYRSGNRKVKMFESDGGEQYDQEKLDKLNADLLEAQRNAGATGRDSGIEKDVNIDTSEMESEILWQKKLSEGKVPYYDLDNPEKMDRFANITKARIAERVNDEYNGDLDAYYTNVESKSGSAFLPDEMKPEFEAQSQARVSEEVLQSFYESNSPSEISGSAMLQDREKKLKGAITQARKKAVEERALYFDGIDAQVADLTEEIAKTERSIDAYSNMSLQQKEKMATQFSEPIDDQVARLEDMKAELAGVQSQKDFFFKLEKNPEQAIAEKFGDMPSVPGDTGMEKARNLFHMYLEGYGSNVADVEATPGDNMLDAIGKGVSKWFNVDQKQQLDEIALNLQALAPIALLNRGPVSENDDAWDVYGKTFITSLVPSTKKSLSTSQEIMQRAENSLALMQVSPEDITTGAADRVSDIASPYDPYSAKDWASMGGTTSAIMVELMASNALMNPVLSATRLGKFIKSAGKTGEIIAKNGDDYMSYLANTKIGRGVVKSTMRGIEEGAKFEVAGELFPHAEDELNFFSGAFGAALATPLNTVIDDKLKKYVLSQYARVFGSKTDDAVEATKLFGKYMEDKLGAATVVTEGVKLPARGVAEVMEEFGNELGNIYRDSDGFGDVITGLEDRFGDLSETMHFAVSSFVMGTAFGATTSVGALNLGKSKSYYEKLSDEERVQFNEFISEYRDEMLEAQEQFAEIKEQENGESTGVEGEGVPVADGGSEGTTEEVGESGEDVSDKAVEPEAEPVAKEDLDTEGTDEVEASEVKDSKKVKVFHGGNMDLDGDKGSVVYVTEDMDQATAYAKGNDGEVNEFELDASRIATEEDAREAIEKLGLTPTEEGWSPDELSLHEMIDPMFDTSFSEEDVAKLFKELESNGKDGIEFSDEDITQKKRSSQTIVVFDKKKLIQDADVNTEAKHPSFTDASEGDIIHTQQEGDRIYNVKKENGEIIVSDMSGKPVKSGEARTKVLDDYKSNYDYNDGKTTMEVDPDGDPSMSADTYHEKVADISENSEEVVQVFNERKETVTEAAEGLDGSKDWAIAEAMSPISQKEFESTTGGKKSGKDFTTKGIALNYFARKDQDHQTLDQIAMSANEAMSGDHTSDQITPNDVLEFILANPNGSNQYKREALKDPTLDALADRFKQLTGMELTDDIVDQVAGPDATEDIAVDDYSWLDSVDDKIDSAIDFVDKLEEGFDTYLKENVSMLPIPPTVIKVALKSVKAALQGGKAMAEAIEVGLSAIRNTGWYKSLSESKQKEADDTFKSGVAAANERAQKASGKKAPKKKRRKFDKSMEEETSSKELNRMINSNRLFYDQVTNRETLQSALDWINKSGGIGAAYEKVSHDKFKYKADDGAMITAVRMLLLDHYSMELDEALRDNSKAEELRSKVNNIREVLAKEATGHGRAIQVLAHWKLNTPLNVLYDLEQRIKEYNETQAKSGGLDADTSKEIDEVAKKLAEEIEALKKKVAESLTTNKELQKTIKSLLAKGHSLNPDSKTESESGNTKKKTRRAPVTRENMKKAKEKFRKAFDKFKKGGGSANASFIGLSNDQIEALGEMAVAIVEMGFIATKDIVNKLNEDLVKDGVTLDINDFEKVVSESDEVKAEQAVQMEKLAKKAVKDNTKLINDIIQDHFTVQEQAGRSLAEKLSEEAGLTGDEAAKLEDMVMKEMRSKVKAKADSIMNKALLKTALKEKVKPKKIIDKMIDMISLGAMDDYVYRGLFGAHFGLIPNLTNEQAQKVKELAENVQNQVTGSIFFNMAVKEMAAYMHELVPRGKWDVFFDVWVGSMYANMLSGPTTSLVNLGSVESHKRMEMLGDMVNMHQHVQAIKKASKEARTTKEFLQGLVAFSAIPNVYYRHAASWYGILRGRGVLDAAQVYDKGGTSSKYIEMLNKTNQLGSNELERKKHKWLFSKKERHRFIGGYVNPFNLLKFSGRNLEGQDSFERAMLEDRYLGEMVRKTFAEQGLRGKQLRQSTIDALKGKGIDIDAILEQVESEAEKFNEKTDKKLTDREKKIRRNELIREAIRDVAGVDSDMEADIVNTADIGVFTGDRHGAIARFAQMLGVVSNYHWSLKVLTIGHVPFTKVVGNVSEFMIDAFPVYGLARASGYSPTGLASRVRHGNWKASEFAEGSSQVAAPGTLAHQKQLARAWFGVAVAGVAWMYLKVEDDDEDPTDNYIFLSGANREGADYGDSNAAYTPYTLRIGSLQVDYRMLPSMVIPLALIGNYNDNKLNKNRYSDDEKENAKQLSERAALAKVVVMQTMGVVFDLSFTEGLEELLQMSVDLDITGGGYATTRKLTEQDDFSFTERKLIKAGAHLLTGAMPQNNNLLRQIEKVYDPTSYSQKDVEGILMYSLGIEKFTGINANVDILGNHTTSLPGKKSLDLDEYFRDPVDLELREFLTEYGAYPSKPTNPSISWGDDEYRKMNADEYYVFTRLSGDMFKSMLEDYVKENDDKTLKERSNKFKTKDRSEMTLVQDDVDKRFDYARKHARDIVRSLVRSGGFQSEYDRLLAEGEASLNE